MAAHIGGLFTGFVVGLLLAGGWNTIDPTGWDCSGRAGLIAALSLGTCLIAGQVIGHARGRILADPDIGPGIRPSSACTAFNKFDAANPVLQDFDRNAEGIARVGEQFDRGDVPAGQIERTLDDLIATADALGRCIATLPVANDEIRAMSDRMVSARTHQRHALDLLKKFLMDGDQSILDGSDGMEASMKDPQGLRPTPKIARSLHQVAQFNFQAPPFQPDIDGLMHDANVSLISELLDLPEQVRKGDFVLNLSEGVTEPEQTLDEYVVTPAARRLLRRRPGLHPRRPSRRRNSKAATCTAASARASRTSWRCCTCSCSTTPPRGPRSGWRRSAPSTAGSRARSSCSCPYHMIGARDMESAILGGYVDHVRELHPDAPLPGVYLADEIFENAVAAPRSSWATRSSSTT